MALHVVRQRRQAERRAGARVELDDPARTSCAGGRPARTARSTRGRALRRPPDRRVRVPRGPRARPRTGDVRDPARRARRRARRRPPRPAPGRRSSRAASRRARAPRRAPRRRRAQPRAQRAAGAAARGDAAACAGASAAAGAAPPPPRSSRSSASANAPVIFPACLATTFCPTEPSMPPSATSASSATRVPSGTGSSRTVLTERTLPAAPRTARPMAVKRISSCGAALGDPHLQVERGGHRARPPA